MMDLESYIEDLERALGVMLPLGGGLAEIFDTIYTTLADRFEVEKIESDINFDAFSFEPDKGFKFDDTFTYYPSISIFTDSEMYKLLLAARYEDEKINQVYRNLSDYTLRIAEAKDPNKIGEILAAFGFFVVGTVGAVVAVATTTLTGGALAALYISMLLSFGAALATFIIGLFNKERSFTSLILNDSNKDGEIEDRYANEGSFKVLPGILDTCRLMIPKKQKVKVTVKDQEIEKELAFVGIVNMFNDSFFRGSEGLVRFSFANTKPEDIDFMFACPWLRNNVTGIDYKRNNESAEHAFNKLIDKRSYDMWLESPTVKGYSTVYNAWGANSKCVSWFQFPKRSD